MYSWPISILDVINNHPTAGDLITHSDGALVWLETLLSWFVSIVKRTHLNNITAKQLFKQGRLETWVCSVIWQLLRLFGLFFNRQIVIKINWKCNSHLNVQNRAYSPCSGLCFIRFCILLANPLKVNFKAKLGLYWTFLVHLCLLIHWLSHSSWLVVFSKANLRSVEYVQQYSQSLCASGRHFTGHLFLRRARTA